MSVRSSASTPVRLGDNLLEIGGKVRVEMGTVLKQDVATEALLSNDVTAPHYKAPQTVDVNGTAVTLHAKDALGKPIKLGEPMHYLDWLGDHHWYVYRHTVEPVLDAHGVAVLGPGGAPVMGEVWAEVSTFDGDEADAIEHARAFLA